jgi:hypothetical protein
LPGIDAVKRLPVSVFPYTPNVKESLSMNRCFGFLALTACCYLVGCNGSNPSTSPVSGVVTLDGKAVEGASVVFNPVDPALRPAMGITDAQGKYVLGTFKADDGAMPGQYKVTVTKYWSEAGDSPYDKPAEPEAKPAKEMTDEEQRAAYQEAYKNAPKGPPKGGAKAPKSGNHLPKAYESADTSGLTHTVTDKPTTFDLTLVSK